MYIQTQASSAIEISTFQMTQLFNRSLGTPIEYLRKERPRPRERENIREQDELREFSLLLGKLFRINNFQEIQQDVECKLKMK